MPNRKLLSAAVLAASITGGGAVGVVLGAPALTSAQESDSTDSTTTTTTPEDCEGRVPSGEGRGLGRHFLDRAVVADALGITEDELTEGIFSGYDDDGTGFIEEPELTDIGDDMGDEGFWDV